MKTTRTLRALIIFAILISNVGCDQVSKSIARQRLDIHAPIDVINNYVTLTLIKAENSGAFLGMGSSWPEPLRFFLLGFIPMLALGLAIVFVLTTKRLTSASLVGFCFIVGGGIGNIFDRLVHGSVTDFLHINFVIFKTGIFNMADVSIMTGAFMVFLSLMLDGKKNPNIGNLRNS